MQMDKQTKERKNTFCVPWKENTNKLSSPMKRLLPRDHAQQKQVNQLMSDF